MLEQECKNWVSNQKPGEETAKVLIPDVYFK